MFFYYKSDIIITITSKCSLFSPWHSRQISHLALNNNRSLNHYTGLLLWLLYVYYLEQLVHEQKCFSLQQVFYQINGKVHYFLWLKDFSKSK